MNKSWIIVVCATINCLISIVNLDIILMLTSIVFLHLALDIQKNEFELPNCEESEKT